MSPSLPDVGVFEPLADEWLVVIDPQAIFADPAQPYLPDDLRRRRASLLRHGELVVIPGGHHLHMQQAADVAAAIGDFYRG